jgi:hypothetical protein
MNEYKIINAAIPGYVGVQQIAIRDRQIVAIDRVVSSDLPIVDVCGSSDQWSIGIGIS